MKDIHTIRHTRSFNWEQGVSQDGATLLEREKQPILRIPFQYFNFA